MSDRVSNPQTPSMEPASGTASDGKGTALAATPSHSKVLFTKEDNGFLSCTYEGKMINPDTAHHYEKASKLYYDKLAPHVLRLSRLSPRFSGCYSSGGKKSASYAANQEAYQEACQARDRFDEIYHVRPDGTFMPWEEASIQSPAWQEQVEAMTACQDQTQGDEDAASTIPGSSLGQP